MHQHLRLRERGIDRRAVGAVERLHVAAIQRRHQWRPATGRRTGAVRVQATRCRRRAGRWRCDGLDCAQRRVTASSNNASAFASIDRVGGCPCRVSSSGNRPRHPPPAPRTRRPAANRTCAIRPHVFLVRRQDPITIADPGPLASSLRAPVAASPHPSGRPGGRRCRRAAQRGIRAVRFGAGRLTRGQFMRTG